MSDNSLLEFIPIFSILANILLNDNFDDIVNVGDFDRGPNRG